MLLLRRTARRVSGAFWGAVYGILNLLLWFRYRAQLLWLGVSERYIREAFCYFVQLNIDDWYASGDLQVRARGLEMHVKEGKVYEFVLFQDHNGQLVVHEWREQKRKLHIGWNEFGKTHETHWWEVFRSGSFIRSTRFIDYLRQLYGDGDLKLCSNQETLSASAFPSTTTGISPIGIAELSPSCTKTAGPA